MASNEMGAGGVAPAESSAAQDGLACACGATFQGQAKFCPSCGSARQDARSRCETSQSDFSKKRHSAVNDIITVERVEVREPFILEKALAELVGTFMLVFTVGVAVASPAGDAAYAIGLMLGIQIYCFGSISGAMFNPAVTLAVLISGRDKISLRDAGIYVASQLLGGLLAGFISFGATQRSFCFDYEQLGDDYDQEPNFGKSLILEVVYTMALCMTVLTTGTSNDCPNQYFGFAIGLTVTGGAVASGGFDQGSFNPAVTLGMNMANYANSNSERNPSAEAWLLYLLAPLLGSVLAAGIYRGTRGNEYEAFKNGATPRIQAKHTE